MRGTNGQQHQPCKQYDGCQHERPARHSAETGDGIAEQPGSRKIAGPWEQNPYTNRQWQRKLYPNAFAPSHGVSLGNKGLYYVHSTFLVHPELWTTLEDAKKHSDALMSADGWTLSDDFVIRSR